MGASNFYTKSASRHFTVLTSYEETVYKCNDCEAIHYDHVRRCDECDSQDTQEETRIVYPDEYQYNDKISDLQYQLKAIGYNIEDHRVDDAKCFASFTDTKSYGDVEIGFKVETVIRSAYYDGATLDYILYCEEGYEYNDIDSLVADTQARMEESYHMNSGMVKIQTKHAEKWLRSELQQVIDKLEKFYEENSNPLRTVATMSNGVAIYEKA